MVIRKKMFFVFIFFLFLCSEIENEIQGPLKMSEINIVVNTHTVELQWLEH